LSHAVYDHQTGKRTPFTENTGGQSKIAHRKKSSVKIRGDRSVLQAIHCNAGLSVKPAENDAMKYSSPGEVGTIDESPHLKKARNLTYVQVEGGGCGGGKAKTTVSQNSLGKSNSQWSRVLWYVSGTAEGTGRGGGGGGGLVMNMCAPLQKTHGTSPTGLDQNKKKVFKGGEGVTTREYSSRRKKSRPGMPYRLAMDKTEQKEAVWVFRPLIRRADSYLVLAVIKKLSRVLKMCEVKLLSRG